MADSAELPCRGRNTIQQPASILASFGVSAHAERRKLNSFNHFVVGHYRLQVWLRPLPLRVVCMGRVAGGLHVFGWKRRGSTFQSRPGRSRLKPGKSLNTSFSRVGRSCCSMTKGEDTVFEKVVNPEMVHNEQLFCFRPQVFANSSPAPIDVFRDRASSSDFYPCTFAPPVNVHIAPARRHAGAKRKSA